MKKRVVSLLMICALSVGMLAGCGSSETQNQATGSADNTQTAGTETVAETKTPEVADDANLTATQQIIKQAEGMTMEELAQKAIEESNGKTFYGVGNSSRGKAALPLFIEYLQSIDPSYSMEFDWQQPKNNKIFEQLTADSLKPEGTFAMTLIQDGNQIESKMTQTGILDTFIPKEWAEANGTTPDAVDGYLALQTLNKVFEYNCTGDKVYDNCWDFVAEGTHALFMDIDFEIKRGERVALIGNNGTGKTTILKLINGIIPPDSGSIYLGAKVSIGYYDQEHHVLDPDKTLFQEIQDAYPDLNNTQIRNTLAAFLFTDDDVFKYIRDLSGGERGRVSLAKLMLSNANLLILDEPTNHLDIVSKEILENALNSYTGTILYVSHDRYFINATATRIIELTNQNIVNYIGNYDYYL